MDDAAPKLQSAGEAEVSLPTRLLHTGCILCALLMAAMLAANVGAVLTQDELKVLLLRQWVLTPGLFLLNLLLLAVLILAKTLRPSGIRRLTRLTERLYFVLAMTVLVLLPSAVLGWMWASRLQPVSGAVATSSVEALAQLMVLLLMWRNALDAARLRV
ncbi:MAG: hypothetical protein J0H09_15345 [Burkholderiales bacterium]|nr:hypothetical protein [Burkholderiales bacterium]